MRVPLLLACAFFPLAASAQITVTSAQASGSQIYIGRAACKTQLLNFSYDVTAGHPITGEEVRLIKARTTNACSSASDPTAPDEILPAPSQSQTGNVQYNASIFLLDNGSDGDTGATCDTIGHTSGSPYTAHFCVQLHPTSGTGSPSYGDMPINFATVDPTPPINVATSTGDQHLRVTWDPGDSAENIVSYDVHVSASPDGGVADLTKFASEVKAQTNADVTTLDDGTALQNDQTYYLTVVANDAYGNQSALSATVAGTPKHVSDFYNHYNEDGGGARGLHGCSSAGTGFWVLGLALGAALIARRKRRGAGLLVLALLLPSLAQAAPYQRPERKFFFAFKVDRYDPKVDSEFSNGLTPYHDIFGTRKPIRYQIEADWEVAHPFGSLLVGATFGYWQNIGNGLLVDGTKSGDTALLDVLPFGLVGTYRFDWLADKWQRFPLIPYAQAGLSRALWASFSGTGAVSRGNDGSRGSGWTYGYTTALGVAVALDSLDPDLSLEAYNDTGIQRSSLFMEYGWTYLNNFGKSNALILSDKGWRFGISLEF